MVAITQAIIHINKVASMVIASTAHTDRVVDMAQAIQRNKVALNKAHRDRADMAQVIQHNRVAMSKANRDKAHISLVDTTNMPIAQ
jgi:hypothetical protein